MTNEHDMNFQATSTQQGQRFEEAAEMMLLCAGWAIVARHAKIDHVEVDIVAVTPTGETWWIECKGSWRGKRPGSKRDDTVKKAVGVAWYLHTLPDACPYMLITSHLPNPDSVPRRLLDAALAHGLFAQINTLGFIDAADEEDDG